MGNSNSNHSQPRPQPKPQPRPKCAPDYNAIIWSTGGGAATGALGGAARHGAVGVVPGAIYGGAMAASVQSGKDAHRVEVCMKQQSAVQRAREIHVPNAPLMRQGMPGSYPYANRPK